jgi:phosphoribosyl-ATP pyrophosphohydrolase
MDNKELISSISLSADGDENIRDLAENYNDNATDMVLVFDLSKNDAEHEIVLGKIKEFATVCEAKVIGAGNIDRMEDVKKLIYAGCKMAALNLAKPSNVDLLEEVSLKFGKEKIAVCLKVIAEFEDNQEAIEKYANTIICLNEDVMQVTKQTSLKVLLNGELESVKAKSMTSNLAWSEFKVGRDGLIPVIVQDYKTDEVLMMAYMNEEAFDKTLAEGKMTYFSRSRDELWTKGLTSGHFQYMKSLTIDCDKDTILAKVSQVGVACHTGARSCFFNELAKKDYKESNPLKVFQDVFDVILDRKENPKEGSYTNYLFDKGVDKILKKVGEECTEIVIAAKNPDSEEIKYEIADFLYHVMVLMADKGVTWEDITAELAHRS